MTYLRKAIKVLASVKLAVFIISLLGVLISVGTVIESKYDAWTAKNWVYASGWMYFAMGSLAVSLIAVIVDRWPWRPRHLAFILAHVGILFLLYGSFLTLVHGIDGTIQLPKDQSPVKDITTQETEINVYRSFDGADYEKIYSETVNFLKNPVRPERPFLVKSKGLDFEILKSISYSLPQQKIEFSTQPQSGAALRFQLSNQNVSEIEWLYQRNVFDKVEKSVGPVLVSFGGLWERNPDVHEIRFKMKADATLYYELYRKNEFKPQAQGRVTEGGLIKTNWMGLECRILRFYPKAMQTFNIQPKEHPTPSTLPSLQVRYNGQESYLFLNDYIKVFTKDRVYLVAYQNRRLPLGFEISLLNFKKTDYPGTRKAMGYESQVQYDGHNQALISMNEPLKYKDFYFYQASFEETGSGFIRSSILSVNHDPGRAWKYVGCFVMCAGIILLFFFRKYPFLST